MATRLKEVGSRREPGVCGERPVGDKERGEGARAAGARFGGTFYVDSLSVSSGPAPTVLKLQRHNIGLIVAGLAAPVPAPAPAR